MENCEKKREREVNGLLFQIQEGLTEYGSLIPRIERTIERIRIPEPKPEPKEPGQVDGGKSIRERSVVEILMDIRDKVTYENDKFRLNADALDDLV